MENAQPVTMCALNENIICGWENCPETVRSTVNDIVDYYRQLLSDDLIGLYLHGSLAMGCFYPKSSDVDFLTVVQQKLTVAEKQKIIQYLVSIPDVRFEMSIVTEDALKNIEYPTPFELHYNSDHRDRYVNEAFDWTTQRYDEDLALHFETVRQRGICLFGKPIEDMFPQIPKEICLASIEQELDWINDRFDTLPATYTVLNPCRAIAFLREGKFMSKKEGGEWAIDNLPADFGDAIKRTLAVYTGTEDTIDPDEKMLHDIMDYTRNEISRYSHNRNPKK